MAKLTIVEEMDLKVQFLLRKFKGTEWSGPAWFVVTDKTKKGFPVNFKLIDFVVANVGSTAETEWGHDEHAQILTKRIPELAERFPKEWEEKRIYGGNIHSHHEMKAYFSGTDQAALTEHAPEEGFWPSLVVSTTSEAPWAFAFSFQNQYGQVWHSTFDFTKKDKIEIERPVVENPMFEAELVEFAKKNQFTYQGADVGTSPMVYDSTTGLYKPKYDYSNAKFPKTKSISYGDSGQLDAFDYVSLAYSKCTTGYITVLTLGVIEDAVADFMMNKLSFQDLYVVISTEIKVAQTAETFFAALRQYLKDDGYKKLKATTN